MPVPAVDPADAAALLAELDLSIEDLHAAVRAGDAERRTYTLLDPPLMPGIGAWGRTVRVLRETLIPRGWEFDNPWNLSRTIHPSAQFCIIVNTGDVATGDTRYRPDTKYPRGERAARAVEANSQLAFTGEGFPDEPDLDEATPAVIATWFLLIHADEDEVRCELSLPDRIDEGGHILGWKQRIVLPPLPFDTGGQDEPDEGPDFDVPVRPRR